MKVGDVVMLRSGGPKMTVTVVRDDTVTVDWFYEEETTTAGRRFGDVQTANFSMTALMEVK